MVLTQFSADQVNPCLTKPKGFDTEEQSPIMEGDKQTKYKSKKYPYEFFS
jgi:hypothetical protein